MTKSFIKKILVAAALSLTLSLQLAAPALAASDPAALTASQRGVDYLGTNQTAAGGVSGLTDVTDWAVIAVAANGQNPSTFSNGGDSATVYLLAHPLTNTASATDVEKRILALVAAAQDTANFGGVDYNALLASYHNTKQIGDPILLNDDIFGIIAAHAAGDAALKTMAQDGLDYLIAHQGIDGGFSYTTATCAYCGSDSNDTAAALIALEAAKAMGLTNADLTAATDDAKAYLLSTKQTDGGFGYDVYSPSDGSSTAWVLMALNALGSSVQTEALAARDWLLANQNSDGGFSYGAFGFTTSDTYTSAHAVIALLGTTWLLNPAPLKHILPAPAPQIPQTPPAPQTTTPPVPAPPVPAPPATPTTKATYTVQTTTSPAADTATPQVLSTVAPVENTPTTKKDTVATTAKTKAKSSYTLYVVIGLVLVAIGWFVLQSRSKQTKG